MADTRAGHGAVSICGERWLVPESRLDRMAHGLANRVVSTSTARQTTMGTARRGTRYPANCNKKQRPHQQN